MESELTSTRSHSAVNSPHRACLAIASVVTLPEAHSGSANGSSTRRARCVSVPHANVVKHNAKQNDPNYCNLGKQRLQVGIDAQHCDAWTVDDVKIEPACFLQSRDAFAHEDNGENTDEDAADREELTDR